MDRYGRHQGSVCKGRNGTRTIPRCAGYSGTAWCGGAIDAAKEPRPNFRADFDRYPALWGGLRRKLCPRIHFKIMIFDCEVAYVGSANLTGADIGMKSEGKRNIEAGILTDKPGLVDAAADHFDSVWIGAHCPSCSAKVIVRIASYNHVSEALNIIPSCSAKLYSGTP